MKERSMSIEIKETLTRTCCEESDLLQYFGQSPNYEYISKYKLAFCKHCGQLWVAHGSSDWRRVQWSGQYV